MNILCEKLILYYRTNTTLEYTVPGVADGTTLKLSVRLTPDWNTPSMCDAEGVVTAGKIVFDCDTYTAEFCSVCKNNDMAWLEVYDDSENERKVYLQRRLVVKSRVGTLDGQPPAPPDEYYTSAQIDEMFTHYYTSDQVDGILEIYYTSDQVNNILTHYYTSDQINTLFEDYYTSDQVNSLLETKEDVGVANALVDAHITDAEAHKTLFDAKENVGVASTLVDEHNSNMSAHNGHLVPEYGNDRSVLVCDGGTASKWQYGDTYEVVITNTVKATPNAIFEIDMYDNKTINIEPPTENDVDFGIVVMQGDVPYSITLSGVGCSVLFPDQSEVPLYNESNLPQSVDGTNTAYMIRFHWDSYSKSLLSNVAYGINLQPVSGLRGVFIKSGNTVVSSAMIIPDTSLTSQTIIVYDGGRVQNCTTYGRFDIYSGGRMNNLELYASGNVYSGGVIDTLSNCAGYIRVSGGAVNKMLGSGSFYILSGGVVNSATVCSGSLLSASYATLGVVSSLTPANDNISYDHSYAERVVGGYRIASSYTKYLERSTGSTQIVGGTVASAYFTNNASVQASSGAVVQNFILDDRSAGNQWKNVSAKHGIIRNSAYLGCDSNCVFEDISVSSGGQYVQKTSTGVCSDLKVYSGGSALIRAATDFKKLTVSGGQAIVQNSNISDVYIESAKQNDVFFGYNNSVSDMVVSGGYIDLVVNTSACNIKGYNPTLFSVMSNTNINNVLMSGGAVGVVGNTAVSDATFSSCNGTIDFARNQSVSNTTFTNCTVDFVSNTVASDVTFINGTVNFVGAQSASNITFSGGTAVLANNQNVSGVTLNNATVEFGSNHLYGVVVNDGNYDFGATPTTDVVMNGGAVLLNRPSPADGVIINGGTMTVDGMAVANNVVVGSNGSLCVNEMGLASNVTSETGATIIVAEGGTISYK